jgi:putative ABC transport system permease protein
VVFQVALSLGLAVSVLIISQQISHMRGRSLGVRKDNVLVVHGPKVKDESYLSNLETFKRSLESMPTVEYMSTVSSLVGEVTGAGRDFGLEAGVSQFLRIIRVEDDFDKVMELPTIAGTTFSRERVAADSGLVLNEAAVKQMGFASPDAALQRTITWRNVGSPIQSKIVGVIKDYHPSAQSEAVPTVFILNRTYSAPWDPEFYIISLRANTFAEVNSTVNNVNETWKEIFTADPFTYYFVDDFYNRQFKVEVTFGRIVTLFSALAILLSCIGILALASFSNFMRQKEIGIRKVLGSSERQIHLLLLRDYIVLLVVGAMISAPFIFYLFKLWLANFSYRIQLSAWYFLVPSGALLILMSVIILFQSYRIVRKNPVNVLRAE